MRRTEQTTRMLKESMGTALLKMMEEKPVEKISIEEMTAMADVGRSTYFRHFKSKDDVLTFKIMCQFEDYLKGRGLDPASLDDEHLGRIVFDFFSTIKPEIALIYKAGHSQVFLDFFLRMLEPNQKKALEQLSSIQVSYYSQIFAYLCFGFFDTWVKRDFKESSEELEALLVPETSQK